MIKRLDREFYKQDAVSAAKNLLGKLLIREIEDELIITKIVETEAYLGAEDKASHAFANNRTERTKVMFKEGGYAYIYLIYGMYYLLNIVTGKENSPEAVLIRALEPLEGLDLLKKNRKIKSDKLADLTNGPGKLTQALNIDKNFNNYDLVEGDKLYLGEDTENKESPVIKSAKRINIDYAEEYKDKEWRFYINESLFLSK